MINVLGTFTVQSCYNIHEELMILTCDLDSLDPERKLLK